MHNRNLSAETCRGAAFALENNRLELFRRRIMDAKYFIHAVTSKVNTARAMYAHEQEATQNECSCLPLLIHQKIADAKRAKLSGLILRNSPLGGESERTIFAFVTLVCCKHTIDFAGEKTIRPQPA
jgi:hypothetical protein